MELYWSSWASNLLYDGNALFFVSLSFKEYMEESINQLVIDDEDVDSDPAIVNRTKGRMIPRVGRLSSFSDEGHILWSQNII